MTTTITLNLDEQTFTQLDSYAKNAKLTKEEYLLHLLHAKTHEIEEVEPDDWEKAAFTEFEEQMKNGTFEGVLMTENLINQYK